MEKDEKKDQGAGAAQDQKENGRRVIIIGTEHQRDYPNNCVVVNNNGYPLERTVQNCGLDSRPSITNSRWMYWVIGIILSLILLSFVVYSVYQDGKKTEQIKNNEKNIEKVEAKADKALENSGKAYSKAERAESTAKRAESKADKALQIGEQNSQDIITVASYVKNQETLDDQTPKEGDDEFTQIINNRVKKALSGKK